MRTLNLTILLIALCSAVNANERIYKRLNKMYLSNPELCLEKSKKIIAKKPSERVLIILSQASISTKLTNQHLHVVAICNCADL